MENNKKANLIKGTLVAGALLSVTALSAIPNSSGLFDYRVLGSGAEVRTEILNDGAVRFNHFEASCGEKAEKKAAAKSAETKAAEAKCGEGKCGEGKCGGDDKKTDAKKAVKGEKAVKATKAKAKEAESKAKEAKCGEKK